MNTRKGELAEWLRSGLQIRKRQHAQRPKIERNNPVLAHLIFVRKSAEQAGNVRNASRSLIGGAA